jgi:histidinol-phosphate phosphatase family protein
MTPQPARAGVFLDRDDTLIHCTDITPDGDLGDPALVRLLPGAEEGVGRLREAGFALVVVTNQGGVARGRYALADVDRVHERLNALLGGRIDAFRACPYHPEGMVSEFTREHPWRKPAPGMVLDAARELGLDLGRSWLVGDRDRDCESGRAAGCRTILVDPLRQAPPPKEAHPAADFTARDLTDAVDIILSTP